MSNLLETLTNASSYGNTGIQTTSFESTEIIGAILVPKAWRINNTYLGTLGASLKSNMQADTRKAIGLRIFPISGFGAITDGSQEAKFQTFGYGARKFALDKKYDFTFDLLEGGISLINAMRAFNKADYDVLFWNSDNVLLCTKTGVTADERKGFSVNNIFVDGWKPADGTNATGHKITFSMSMAATKEMNENLGYIACDFDIATQIKGCINVLASSLHTASTTKMYIGLTTNEGSVDLVTLYGSSITKAGAIILKNADGSVNTPSGVAAGATYGGLEITGTFVTSTNMTFQLETPTALAALSPAIGAEPENGLESNILTVAIP